jgi:hypothetical protein
VTLLTIFELKHKDTPIFALFDVEELGLARKDNEVL